MYVATVKQPAVQEGNVTQYGRNGCALGNEKQVKKKNHEMVDQASEFAMLICDFSSPTPSPWPQTGHATARARSQTPYRFNRCGTSRARLVMTILQPTEGPVPFICLIESLENLERYSGQ